MTNDERDAQASPAVWHAIDFIVCEEASEATQYALLEIGATGTETRPTDAHTADADRTEPRCKHVNISGYFAHAPERETVRRSLADAWKIYDLRRLKLPCDWKSREVPARDWLAEWKRGWQPVVVGRFIIAPSWSEIEDAEDKIVIRIEPGMAFGTGTHETTRLCLAAIERYFDGASFLDVGTGTGVLAIAAAKQNPRARIEACDTDADAIEIARENARVNGVGERISFRVGTIDETTLSADCVCANLTADAIIPLLPALLGATCGRLILSGILTMQTESVRERLEEIGVRDYEVKTDGEWAAITI